MFVKPDILHQANSPLLPRLHTVIILDSIKAVPFPWLISAPTALGVHVCVSKALIHTFIYTKCLFLMKAGVFSNEAAVVLRRHAVCMFMAPLYFR